MRVTGKHVIFSFVLLVLGFLISFSYQITNKKLEDTPSITEWQREYELRDALLRQEEKTKSLQEELAQKQTETREIESSLATQEKTFFNVVEDVEKLRLYAGVIKTRGPGIVVTLEDATYDGISNPNNYIVHEIHIHKLINELLASGAKAIAINGQRLLHNSYITCIGPVISVDGNEYNAPFVISAIGDPEVLNSALNIAQGVKVQLVLDNIEVKIEKKEEIIFDPYLGISEEQI
jgi:uncharacterized protein YlxW (UPF0749 family)